MKPKKGYKIIDGKPRYLKYHVPKEWELESFEKYYSFVKGKLPKDEFENKGINRLPYLTSDNLSGKSEKYIEKSDGVLVNESDFIMIADGEGSGRVYTGKKGILASTFILFKKTQAQLDNLFVFYYLQYYYKLFRDTRYGTGIPHLDKYVLKNLKIPILPEHEYQKITYILSNIDTQILQTLNLINLTKRLKKGLMQNILIKGIGHVKFKNVDWYHRKKIEIPESWQWSTAGEKFDINSGSTPSRQHPEYFQGDIPWIPSTELNYGKIMHTNENLTQEAVEKTNLKIYPKGTFVIAIIGLEAISTRGKCAILGIDSTISQSCAAFSKNKEIDPMFLFYYYTQFSEEIVLTLAQGTKQQNFYPYLIDEVKIPIPPLPEQQKIVSTLSTIDEQIKQYKNEKSHLEQMKKGLMQKLLTGEIRVKV